MRNFVYIRLRACTAFALLLTDVFKYGSDFFKKAESNKTTIVPIIYIHLDAVTVECEECLREFRLVKAIHA